MIDFSIIFVIQLLLMIVGYLVTVLMGVKNKVESLGLSYLFGSGLITLLFLANHFFLNIALGPLNFLLSVSVSLILLIILIIFYSKQKEIISFNPLLLKKNISSFNCFEKLILSFLILILGYTLLENYVWPVTTWDSLALYDFRARVMAEDGNMLAGVKLGYFFQYPPYTSLLHVFGYMFGAERVKVVYSFIYFSLITVFYSLIKRNQKRWVALLGALMMSVDIFIFRHATMAYTNLAYVVFLSLGLIYLGFWLHSSNKKELLVGSILVALSTWIRASDPFWYIGLIIIVIGIIKNKKQIKQGVGLILATIGIYKFWDVFVKSLNLINSKKISREAIYINALFGGTEVYLNLLKSIPEIFLYFAQNLLSTIGYLLPIVFFTIYYDFKKQNTLNRYLYFFIILSLLFILIGIIIFSLFYESWNRIDDSLQRMSMVLIPIIIFTIFNSSIWKKNAFKKK
jgi:hypothetical protein